ncbi:AAA family ATPase [Trinickia terrae]|uniref:AAA family ATPase n=2 Tax=Trinickia terrae TaxID=2571161 RepID=A0A4U1ICC6_9BURK|nr:AAA family ATPase [Trinickia terrae]
MKPEPISWLWRGYMARGKLTILAGEPGTGKTTAAGSLAATTTCGGTWPDGTVAEPGNVVIWSGEDDPKDTLTPRLMSAGADMNRVFFVAGMRVKGKEQGFDPARDMPALQAACEEIGDVRLIVVDPIVSAVAGDSHKNAETRRALQPLVDLAANVGAALLGITHFNKGKQGKNPAQWVNGSVAFTAIARVVIIAAKVASDDGDEHRIFARAKSNIGPDDGGFEYQIEQSEPIPGILSSCIAWGDEVAGSALELLGNHAQDKARGGSAVNSAKAFLADLLDDGEMPVKSIEDHATAAGIALRTLRRASDALGVGKHKGKDAKWYWSLPAKQSIVGSVERLDNMDSMTKPARTHLQLVPNPEAR